MKRTAKWIVSPKNMGMASLTFRRDLTLTRKIKKATVDLTALGVYALFVNGKRVGDDVLAPGWTMYQKRVQYQTYDITALLSAENRIEVGVGAGWAFGKIMTHPKGYVFSDGHTVCGAIEVVYADGTRESIVTDEAWDVYTNEVTFADHYNGETVDKTAPIEYLGKALLAKKTYRTVKQIGEKIVENERISPVEIIRTPKGETVIDFGQNMAGYVEVRANGNRGDRIVLHHAEVLDKEGNFYNANYRSARNEVTYILGGDGEETFKPTYSFQGFRYVHLVEYPSDTVDPKNFCAIVVHSQMKRTGRFSCGNEKINQLYHNVIWGQKGNYLDIPTDCPQRDERLGWTGDAQVFCRTAAINFDVEKFFIKWLGDVALAQKKDGLIPHVVPYVIPWGGATGWADVACIAPWQMYLAYGNRDALRSQYPMMKKWIGYMRAWGDEEYLYLGHDHFGDWLAMDGDPDKYVGSTPRDFIACAYYAYSTSLVVAAGKVLGEDVSEYEALYQNVRAAFRARYIKDGELVLLPNVKPLEGDQPLPKETQTAYTLVLFFGLCEGDEKARFAARLAEMIHENGDRMTTGFLGTPYLLHALSENGYTDVAYTLLMQEKTPSWLYSVNHGATTMWEHWNSLKEDGSFWSTDMNSFNHYAYGAVYDWIFGAAVGIKPLPHAPAYKEFSLEPHPDQCLGFADASIDTRNGFIRAHWYYKGDTVYYEFEIPNGTTAHLRLPSGYTATLGGGIYHFAE